MSCLSCCFEECYRKQMKQQYVQIAYQSQGNIYPQDEGNVLQLSQTECHPSQQLGAYPVPLPSLEVPNLQSAISKQPVPEYRPHQTLVCPHDTELPGVKVLPEHEEPQEENQVSLLQFSVLYDVQHQSLNVHLSGASNLPSNRKASSNPFVRVHLEPKVPDFLESKALSNTLDPGWNEKFTFSGVTHDEVQQQTLVFKVYSYNKYSRSDLIGGVVLSLADADIYGVPIQKTIDENIVDFQTTNMGDLLLSLHYMPKFEVIQGSVLKATNLTRQLRSQQSIRVRDPYVKINLLHKGVRMNKWKTSVKKDALLPVFNEAFEFDVAGLDLKKVTLQVVVMEHDRFRRDHCAGMVLIGAEGDESGQLHWTQMMALAQKKSVSLWHTVLPPCPRTS